MATPTYTPIASITLGSSASSVTFSSIPQDYRDLVLTLNPTGTSYPEFRLQMNSDTGSNYSYVRMFGDSGGASSDSDSSATFISCSNLGNNTTGKVQVMDYSATDKHKSTLGRQGRGGVYALAIAGRYANNSAVTSLKIIVSSGSIESGSTFALYGIAS